MKFKNAFTLLFIVIVILFNVIVANQGLFGTNYRLLTVEYNSVALPAYYAHYIWYIIFLGLLAYGIYQFMFPQNFDSHKQLQKILWINLLLNALWLIAIHAEFVLLSTFTVLLLLASLVYSLHILFSNKHQFRDWIVWVFEIYTAWISVIAIVNISILFKYKFHLFQSTESRLWFLFALLLLLSICCTFIHKWKASVSVFPIVLIWAFVAIHCKHKSDNLIYSFFPLVPLLLVIPNLLLYLIFDIQSQSNKS